MLLYKLPFCLVNRHTPDRHRAKWDGLNFVSRCKACGTRIRRREERVWQKDWIVEKNRSPAPADFVDHR